MATKRMQRTIEIESSQFSPNSYWVYGGEYFAEKTTIEYPAELDSLSDDDLLDLADEEMEDVWYVNLEPIEEAHVCEDGVKI